MFKFAVELFLLLTLDRHFSCVSTAAGNIDATLQIIQPADGPACPGEEVILTCSVPPPTSDSTSNLKWQLLDSQFTFLGMAIITTLGNFTINFFVSQDNHVISNATLSEALLSYNNITIGCRNPATQLLPVTETIMVAGAVSSPSGLNISNSIDTPATLTWLPPTSGSNCTFNYTVNITSNSSSMTEQVYNSTSLTLTNLTRGENYSFAVAVTDSAGQYGAWSEELNVAWNLPSIVTNVNVISTGLVSFIVSWKPPSPPSHLPILYYSVMHNITMSGNAQTINTSELMLILYGAAPGQLYFIAVSAVNIVGRGMETKHTVAVSTSGPNISMSASTHSIIVTNTTSGRYSAVTTTDYCNSDNIQLYSHCFSPIPANGQMYGGCTLLATVAALVSGVLSVIAASLIASCIMWCVVLRGKQKRRDTSPGVQQGVHQQEIPSTELVEYEVPVVKKQGITTQDNVAYGGKISLQQNVAYEQVHVLK